MSHTDQPPSLRSTPPRRRAVLVALGACLACAGLVAAVRGSSKDHAPAPSLLVLNGSPALKETERGALERWPTHAELTITVDASIEQIGPGAHDAVIEAFGTWLGTGAKLPRLRFDSSTGAQVSVHPDGKNVIMFSPIDVPGHKNDLAITVGFADPDSGRLLEADVILNSKKNFAVLDTAPEDQNEAEPDCGRYDLQSVATHEAGHFFGLGEDFDDRAATMYLKTGKCELTKRDLMTSDSTALIGLYSSELGPEAGDDRGCALAPAHVSGSRSEALLCAWLGVLAFCVRRRAR